MPQARGPVSDALIRALAADEAPLLPRRLPGSGDVLADEDLQLALWIGYELHYDGFGDVDPGREWDPDLLRVRRTLEERLIADLRERTRDLVAQVEGDEPLADRLFAMTEGGAGPVEPRPARPTSASAYLRRQADAAQFAEFLVHRSVYNLRETAPQVFAMARLEGAPATAMAELIHDEYGAGRPDRLHSRLFADAMVALGLPARPGGFVDVVPANSLAVVNVMHLLALRRELVPAAMGHFGAFEATSSEPSRRICQGAERLGLDPAVLIYFDEHVEADAVHEQLAFRVVCGGLAEEDPRVEPLILFGAASCLVVEEAAGRRMVSAWEAGRSSLRDDVVREEVS